MAGVSNVNRLATTKVLIQHVALLVAQAGLVVQTHRAYESGAKSGRGLLQEEVAKKARVSKSLVGMLERGVNIPRDGNLRRILRASGMRLGGHTAGEGFYQLLCAIRRYRGQVSRLGKETPR